ARSRTREEIAERHAAQQNRERGHARARRRDADRRPRRAPIDIRPVRRAELRPPPNEGSPQIAGQQRRQPQQRTRSGTFHRAYCAAASITACTEGGMACPLPLTLGLMTSTPCFFSRARPFALTT